MKQRERTVKAAAGFVLAFFAAAVLCMSPADAYARPAPEPVVKGISAKGPGVHRGELADYAGQLYQESPHPEWDKYMNCCYTIYEENPGIDGPVYIKETRRKQMEELILISHYINNEFGYARDLYINVYRLTDGGYALGFAHTMKEREALEEYRHEAETMEQKAKELKGNTETETLNNIFAFAKAEYPRAEYGDDDDPRDYYYGWFSGHPLICNGRAKLVSMMARFNGMDAQVVFGSLHGTSPHAWAEVRADGVVYQCDPSLQWSILTALPGQYQRDDGWPVLE